MRIAISGTGCQGKSTLVKDIISRWPMFNLESETYRDLITRENLPHSKQATKDGQWKILNHMMDEMQKYNRNDKVVFDRCPLDNIAYSIWKCERGDGDIDDEFIKKCLPIVRESMKFVDIIFFIPITKFNNIEIEDDGMRETDETYIREIDNIFKAIKMQYEHAPQQTQFFPRDDVPAIIEVFGNRQERIKLIEMYLDNDGDLIGGEDGSTDLFNPENLNMLETLLKEQQDINKKEKLYKEEAAKIKEFINRTV